MRNVISCIKRAKALALLCTATPIDMVAKQLGKTRSAVYRMRQRLVAKGLLSQNYWPTPAGEKAMEKGLMLSKNVTRQNGIRLHAVGLVVKLAGKPFDWDARREHWVVALQGTKWKLASGVFTEVRVCDWLKVRTTPSSVVFYFGEVWADDPVEAKNRLFDLMQAGVSQVERALGVKLHKGGLWVFKTARQEHAVVKNALAVELAKAGFKIAVQDLTGKNRVVVDASLGFGEVETPHSLNGEEDAIALKGLFEDVVVWGLSLKDLAGRLERLEGRITGTGGGEGLPAKPERREIV